MNVDYSFGTFSQNLSRTFAMKVKHLSGGSENSNCMAFTAAIPISITLTQSSASETDMINSDDPHCKAVIEAFENCKQSVMDNGLLYTLCQRLDELENKHNYKPLNHHIGLAITNAKKAIEFKRPEKRAETINEIYESIYRLPIVLNQRKNPASH